MRAIAYLPVITGNTQNDGKDQATVTSRDGYQQPGQIATWRSKPDYVEPNAAVNLVSMCAYIRTAI